MSYGKNKSYSKSKKKKKDRDKALVVSKAMKKKKY